MHMCLCICMDAILVYGMLAKYQPHWKKSRVIHTEIHWKRREKEKETVKNSEKDKDGDKETSQCANASKRRREFFQPDRIGNSRSHSRSSLFTVTFRISCEYASAHALYHSPPCANDNAAVYFSTASDHFDVLVIDAPSPTLREDHINQRCGRAAASFASPGIAGADAAPARAPTINRIRDRQLTYRGESPRNVSAYTLSRIHMHSMQRRLHRSGCHIRCETMAGRFEIT